MTTKKIYIAKNGNVIEQVNFFVYSGSASRILRKATLADYRAFQKRINQRFTLEK